MCDRPIPQQNLCSEIAGLVDVIAAAGRRADVAAAGGNGNNEGEGEGSSLEVAVVTSWLAAFWETIAREWTSIDVLRLEKFLLLVRRMFGASLAWAFQGDSKTKRTAAGKKSKSSSSSKKAAAAKTTSTNGKKRKSRTTQAEEDEEEEETDATERPSSSSSGGSSMIRQSAVIDLIQRYPLEEKGDFGAVPVGLRLHVLDIWVDEAEKAGLLPPSQQQGSTTTSGEKEAADEQNWPYLLTALRQAVEKQQQNTPSKPIRARAKESLGDERLPWNVAGGSDVDEDGDANMGDGGEEDGWGGFDD